MRASGASSTAFPILIVILILILILLIPAKVFAISADIKPAVHRGQLNELLMHGY